jgi:hypothetical protein
MSNDLLATFLDRDRFVACGSSQGQNCHCERSEAIYAIFRRFREIAMCRNIKTLYNFKPPATDDEIRASALQFVRKLSGFTRPSKGNQLAFDRAVDEVTKAAQDLLGSLVTTASPRDREVEASKARARAADRFHPAEGPTAR